MSTGSQTATGALRERGAEMNEAMREAAGRARHELEPLLRRADETTRRVVSDHPLAALFGAIAAGYVIGRLLAARR
jgi:hypothetical protein